MTLHFVVYVDTKKSKKSQKNQNLKGAVGLRTNWPFAIAEESIAPFFLQPARKDIMAKDIRNSA